MQQERIPQQTPINAREAIEKKDKEIINEIFGAKVETKDRDNESSLLVTINYGRKSMVIKIREGIEIAGSILVNSSLEISVKPNQLALLLHHHNHILLRLQLSLILVCHFPYHLAFSSQFL